MLPMSRIGPIHRRKTIWRREKCSRVFFSRVFVKEPDWTWILREEERPNIRYYLKINIPKELQK